MSKEFSRPFEDHYEDRALPQFLAYSESSRLDSSQPSKSVPAFDTNQSKAQLAYIRLLGFPDCQIGESGKEARKAEKAEPERAKPQEEAEQKLKSAAEKAISDPQKRAALLADMQKFKERADKDKLSDGEYTRTLEQVTKLLEARDGKVSAADRVLAAQGIMYNAARPDTICQIGGTCGGASTEHKIFCKYPSVAADMITSAALKGQWTGKDGKIIKMPEANLASEDGFRQFPPADGQPSYASQLFQITVINDIGQHCKPPMTYLRQAKVEEKNGNSTISYVPEKWVLENGEKRPFASPGTGNFSRTGGLTSFAVANEIYRLTGEKNGVMANRKFDNDDCPASQRPPGISDDNLTDVRSTDELETKVRELKEQGRLPAVVCVSGLAVSALDGSRCFIGQAQDHFVTVAAYQPAKDGQPAKVLLHNQWGSGFNGWMNLKDFYKTTTNNPIKFDQLPKQK